MELTRDKYKEFRKKGYSEEQILKEIKDRGWTLAENKEKPFLSNEQPKETYHKLDPRSWGPKVGEFLPYYEKVGKGITTTAFRFLTPEGRNLEKRIGSGKASEEELKAYWDIHGIEAPTRREFAGGVGEMGIDILTSGIKQPALPFLKGAPWKPAVKYALTWGSARGLFKGVGERDATPEEIVKITAGTAAGSVAFELLLGGAARGLEVTGQKFVSAVSKFAGPTYKDATKRRKALKFLWDKHIWGPSNQMRKKINGYLKQYNLKIKTLLGQSQEVVSKDDVIERGIQMKLMEAKEGVEFIDPSIVYDEFEKALTHVDPSLRMPDSTNYSKWNWIRQQIDDAIGDRTFSKKWEDLPNVKKSLIVLRTAIQDIVAVGHQELTGTTDVADTFFEFTHGLSAKQAINTMVDKLESKSDISIPKIMTGVLVGGSWYAKSRDPKEAISVALITLMATDPRVQMNAGQVIHRLSEILGRNLSGAERAIIYQFISREVKDIVK